MKVTIITVAFNSAKTIEDTIKSVLSQDYPNLEYIIVDGGSSDSTLEIIRSYQDKIAVLISEPDRGMYDAMNKGIAKATGEVIGILNSDDTYMSNTTISELMALMQQRAVDIVYADLIIVDPMDRHKVLRYYDSSYFQPTKFKSGWMPAHPTVFVKRHLYEDFGYFKLDYQIAADYEMLIRLLYVHQASYAYLPKPAVRMRFGGASTANLARNWILNQEIIRACRANGIATSWWMLLGKVPFKVWSSVKGKARLRAIK